MSNGDEYFLSDNGRICRMPSDTPTYRNSEFRNTGKDYRRTDGSFGGARPKTTYTHNHMNRGYFTKDIRSTVLHTTDHEARLKYQGRHPEAYRRPSDRPIIEPYDYDHYSANNYDNHTHNGQ